MTIFSVFGFILSLGIILFYGVAVYYSLKLLIVAREAAMVWHAKVSIGLGVIWIMLFSVIGLSIIIGTPLIVETSFGALFIRPAIFLSGVIHAIGRKQMYYANLVERRKRGC